MTTWYRQSAGLFNGEYMLWNDARDGSGNAAAAAPTTGDICDLNGCTVTQDSAIECATITDPVTGGGKLVIDQGYTISATLTSSVTLRIVPGIYDETYTYRSSGIWASLNGVQSSRGWAQEGVVQYFYYLSDYLWYDLSDTTTTPYVNGNNAGLDQGHSEGYSYGYSVGWDQGHQAGYDTGYGAGLYEGIPQGITIEDGAVLYLMVNSPYGQLRLNASIDIPGVNGTICTIYGSYVGLVDSSGSTYSTGILNSQQAYWSDWSGPGVYVTSGYAASGVVYIDPFNATVCAASTGLAETDVKDGTPYVDADGAHEGLLPAGSGTPAVVSAPSF